VGLLFIFARGFHPEPHNAHALSVLCSSSAAAALCLPGLGILILLIWANDGLVLSRRPSFQTLCQESI